MDFLGGRITPGASQPQDTQGVYWIGQDGNVWASNGGAAQNWGQAISTSANGAQAANGSVMGYQIADPNPGNPGAPTAPRQAATGPAPVLNRAAINNTQLSLDQLPGLLEAALAAEATNYANTTKGFAAQKQQQQGAYDESTTTNQQNYDSNLMSAVRAGSKGLHGLLSLLRGAAQGTAGDLARDAVTTNVAGDIRTGADTQKENQTSLDSTLATFLTGLKEKEQKAVDTRANNESAIRRDNATQAQSLYKTMADLYSEGGDTNAATDFLGRAGSLTPTIAQNSRQQVSAYDSTPVEVKAPTISAFEGPTQPNVTSVGNDSGQIGSGIFKIGDARRRRELVGA